MSKGKRREQLHIHLEQQVLPLFSGRIQSFDMDCTQAYARLRAQAKTAGLAISTADGYIAAIALAHQWSIATRDVSPFEAAGIKVINPWEYKHIYQFKALDR